MKKSFKLALVSTALIFASCAKNGTSEASYNVIPMPQQIQHHNGVPFKLDNKTTIVCEAGDITMQRTANFLADYLQFSTGIKPTVTDSPQVSNFILLKSDLQNENNEAYTLDIIDTEIVINGASPAGLFYGIQTLRKSLDVDSNKKEILFPQVSILDFPRFWYRGMHLDTARHFFPLSFLKEYIDLLALHNMNTFHWHITEDQGWRIEIKKYPELTNKGSIRKKTVIGRNSDKYEETEYGGFYTQDEAKELVQYAADRFITIIPEIDLPGHMLAALHAYPEFGCTGGPYEVEPTWGVFDDILCGGNDSVYTFINDVMDELTEIFPSEYIHVGGDEAPKVRWKECPKCQAKIKELGIKGTAKHTAEDQLQTHMLVEVEKHLAEKGRKVIGWDEILEGGLSPDATVMSWRGINGAIEAAEQGHDAIMTSNSHLYFDYYQTTDVDNVPLAIGGYIPLEAVYNFEPVPATLTQDQKSHIIGVQANLWTEYIKDGEQVLYMVLPRMDALSELQWSNPTQKNYEEFIKRLKTMIKLYDKKGYNYSKTIFGLESEIKNNTDNGTAEITLSTIDDAPIYYTLDGTEPTTNSNLYTEPIIISQSTNIKAKAIRPNLETTAFSKNFVVSKSSFKPIELSVAPNKTYAFGGAESLVNGLKGSKNNYKDGSWIGFTNGPIVATIDLKEAQEVSEVEVSTFVVTGDWIFGAESLIVEVSDNGKDFTKVSETNYPMPSSHIEEIITLETKFSPINAKYVRITIDKTKKLPEWHAGAGANAYIFIDEISVN